jgi:N-acetylglucosamine-6-sulfatase
VTNSLCCPSRATILGGLYSRNHRIISNEPPEGGFVRWRDSGLEKKTVAVRFREAGYKTAYFGKYFNGYCNANAGCKEPRYVPLGWSEWHGSVGHTTINDDGTLRDLGDGTVIDDAIRRRVGGFFSRWGRAKPIFLYVSTRAPHGKAIVAERHADLFADEYAPRSPAYSEMDISDIPASMCGASSPTPTKLVARPTLAHSCFAARPCW